jgi:hypothetical protein
MLGRLFRCRVCEAKDAQIEDLKKNLAWAQREVELSRKTLTEIVEPHANSRIAHSERPRPAAMRLVPGPAIPGFEPPVQTFVEVDAPAEGA